MRMGKCSVLVMAMISLGFAGCAPDVPPMVETIQSASQALDSSTAWTDAPHMLAARNAHAALKLADGRVLVAGGRDSTAETTEVYDADKKEWTLLDAESIATSATCPPGLAQLDNGIVVMVSTFADVGKMGTVSTFHPSTGVWTSLSATLPIRTCRVNVLALENGRALILADDYDSDKVLPFSFDTDKLDPITSLPTPKVGTWQDAAAIRLVDGRVLVSGGSGANFSPRNPETIIYDPADPNVWTPVGELFFARSNHVMALLPSGNVLAVGGKVTGPYAGEWSNTTEIFDISSMTWVPTTPMNNARGAFHTASRLQTGFILVVGGSIASTAEFFDPSTDTWTPLESPDLYFFNHSATVLDNGSVLVTGGTSLSPQSSNDLVRLCNVSAIAWEPRKSLPTEDRGFHSATKLEDGRLLVVGGIASMSNAPPTSALQDAWVYDPTSDTWTEQDQTSSKYGYHTATKLLDGRVLVAGGIANASAEIFDPFGTTIHWQMATSMPKAIKRATATTLNDKRVLHVGGIYSTGTPFTVPDVFLYDPTSNAWSIGPDLLLGDQASRFGHTATPLDDKDGSVLVVGGCEMPLGDGNVNPPTADAAVFNPKSNTWKSVAPMSRGRAFHSATRLDDGRILVAGGGELAYFSETKPAWSGIYSSAEIYDLATNTWTSAGSMVEGRTEHEAVLLENGYVLISGGRRTMTGRMLPSAEIFDPREKKWTSTSRMQIARYGHSLTLLNGGVIAVGGFHPFSLTESSVERFPQAAQGNACTRNEQCISNHCADGVCCDDACNGECMACSKNATNIKKAKTLGEGFCENVSDCSPFACEAETGACGKTCADVNGCATGYVCDLTSMCIEPLKNASIIDESGCTATPVDSNASPWASLALVAGVYALRRRKNQRKL